MDVKYRPDVDGLRAVAIVPIVLFHAGLDGLSGGFVGVDIFFVISGYLITTIILRDIGQDRFSLVRFYQRRIARIFPALFVMLVTALVAGLLLLLPTEIEALAWSAAAAAASLANVYFWATTDYFAQAAEATPLLHTWSLGVEEQFYLFYPLLLLGIQRFFPSRLRQILWLMVTASFVVGGVMAIQWPAAGFYLLPARAWQLGLGGLIAAGAFPDIRSIARRELLAAAGAALIVTAYCIIRSDSAFPVPWAILPCTGAILLIAYAPGTIVGQALVLSPMVALGRISYSVYLWHWPIITFWRLEHGFQLSAVGMVIVTAASFTAGTLSYLIVERPFNHRLRQAPSVRAIGAGLCGVAAMIAVSSAVPIIGPLQKFDPAIIKVDSYAEYRSRPEYIAQFQTGTCFRSEGDPFRPDICYKLASDRPNFVVMGDSHAAQYWRALAERFPERNVIQASASGCRPLVRPEGAARCIEVMNYVYRRLLPTGRVSTLFLAGRWREDDLPGLVQTLWVLKREYPAINLVLMGPVVEYDGEFPALLARATQSGNEAEIAHERTSGPLAMDAKVERIAKAAGVPYVSAYGIICPGQCALHAPDGGPMHFDYGHLTLSASRWVIGRVPAKIFGT
jgi:peptidoglycan/LPS O-acetylase OafA/YrhL